MIATLLTILVLVVILYLLILFFVIIPAIRKRMIRSTRAALGRFVSRH